MLGRHSGGAWASSISALSTQRRGFGAVRLGADGHSAMRGDAKPGVAKRTSPCWVAIAEALGRVQYQRSVLSAVGLARFGLARTVIALCAATPSRVSPNALRHVGSP